MPVNEIPFFKGYSAVEPINKGFSFDKKYCVTVNNKKYVLRLFEPNTLEQRKEEYDLLKKMETLTEKSLKVYEIGEVDSYGYMITEYFEGVDMEQGLPFISEKKQYELGLEAGYELAKIHTVKAPAHILPWHERKLAKHHRYLKKYELYNIRLEQEQQIIQFIEERLPLMENRPNMLQHDDFHPSNLIIKDENFEGIIDFGRYDWGDPIEDFVKVGLFTRGVSVPFAVGQIKGYFNGEEPPNEFWELYSLYLAMTLFTTIVWAKELHPNNLDVLLVKNKQILEDHAYFSLIKPKWYN